MNTRNEGLSFEGSSDTTRPNFGVQQRMDGRSGVVTEQVDGTEDAEAYIGVEVGMY